MYLIDKALFVVAKVVDLLIEQDTHSAGMGLHEDQRAKAMAVTLYREGRRAFGPEQWEAFLVSSNDLMRAKDRLDVSTSVDSFFRVVDMLLLAGTGGPTPSAPSPTT